ncbi:hypothetical protein GCM10025875_24280 [Litorihabitans aurantiacus]|uniref:PhoU domain-containing protein n=1 Tax=Litorihabitans aurantiacus TaxID=1930061 RepID=A0AA37XG21_9MICO|nr:hypothetical protein GCM10025875_24280 [Litorihabitans aurantiacus]
MREIFRQDLEQVGDDLVLMAQKVRTAMRDATTALTTGDLALAERVIAADREIDQVQDSSTRSASRCWRARPRSPATCASS